MNLKIEIRYAVLMSLLMLLWLSLEFMVGLQDTYIQYHPYVTMFALIIPIVCSRMVLRDKLEQLNGKIDFKQGLKTGIMVVVFAALLSIPVQLAFHFLINPDFFDDMRAYSINRAMMLGLDVAKAKVDAIAYFNLLSYLLQSFFGTLIFGSIIATVMAWRMRTDK